MDQPVMAAGTGERRPTTRPTAIPRRIPITPPVTVRAIASSRNWRSTSRVRAPTALRSPISRVRSETLTSMMFITPTPPTSSEIPAIEASTMVRIDSTLPTTPRMSPWVSTWKSWSGCERVTTSRMIRCSSGMSPGEIALTAMPSTRLTPNRRCAAVTGMKASWLRSTPRVVPTRLSTPTTRKRTAMSDSLKKVPRSTVRSKTKGMVSLVPFRFTCARRGPTRASSPEATVAATRSGSPTASPMRRTSSRVRRERAGAEPMEKSPGATNRMLEPSDSMPEVTSLRAPLPIATSSTTLVTPITTPSMVRPDRSLLAWSASHASRTSSVCHPLQAPVADQQGVVEAGGHASVVGDHHHRHAALGPQPRQQLQDLVAGARVEVAGRLVGQQHRRLGRQRPGDRHPLLLAAGELRGPVQQALGEAHGLQGLGGAPAPLGPAEPAVDQREADVAERRGPRQELEVLEDEADHLVAEPGQLVVGQPGDVAPLERQAAAGRPVQAAEQAEQGGLPRAARSHDRQRVPARDRHVHAVERADLDPLHAVDLGDPARLHDREPLRGPGQPPSPLGGVHPVSPRASSRRREGGPCRPRSRTPPAGRGRGRSAPSRAPTRNRAPGAPGCRRWRSCPPVGPARRRRPAPGRPRRSRRLRPTGSTRAPPRSAAPWRRSWRRGRRRAGRPPAGRP